MAPRSAAVSKKQPITIDVESISENLSPYQTEIEQIKSTGMMIYDADSFDQAADMVIRAEKLKTKIEETFKPAADAIKAASKVLKASTEAFTAPLEKYAEAGRKQLYEFLSENRDTNPELGRIQASRWKLIVKDEEALLRSMVIATNKKGEDGKMYIDIQFNPQIRPLFVYNEAKGNALASVVTTTMPISGCEVKQSDMLVLTGEK
jgi:hypothetical protein